MAVPFSNTKLRVPSGFQNLLWVLSKEVIRDAPGDVVEYSADFFRKLLQIREITGHDPAQHGAHSEDRFYNNFVFKGAPPVNIDILSEEPQVQETEAPKPTEQDGTTATEPATEQENAQQQTKSQTTSTATSEPSEKPAGDHRDSLEISIDPDDPAMQEAAVKIQARFRGHLARQSSRSGSRQVVCLADQEPPTQEAPAQEPSSTVNNGNSKGNGQQMDTLNDQDLSTH